MTPTFYKKENPYENAFLSLDEYNLNIYLSAKTTTLVKQTIVPLSLC